MMKHIKYEASIKDWGLVNDSPLHNALTKTIEEALTQAISYAFEDDETYIYWPAEWSGMDSDGIGNQPPDDPLTVYLRVGFDNEGEVEKPTYSFNLRECLKDTIEQCGIDGSFSTGLKRIRDGLIKLTEEIDEVLK